LGFDSRKITPELAAAVVFLAAEIRSFERATVEAFTPRAKMAGGKPKTPRWNA